MSAENKPRILKGKDAIAEGLDNKASMKAIMDSIFHKKVKAKSIVNYVDWTSRRRCNTNPHFCATDFLYPTQPRNLFNEDWDGGLDSGFFESFSHKSLMPWMMTTVHNSGRSDPLTDLLRERYEWNRKWTLFKHSFGISKRCTYKWFDDDLLYCSKVFPDMAAHLQTKPDPYFEDAYNWYYAGKGNLHVAQFDGSDYLVYSVFNSLYISPFFRDSLSIDYANTATYQCTENSNIMETVYSLNIIALRTKCKVIILKVVIAESAMKLERVKEMDSELPFTSITFDEFHKNILYVTTLDYQLTIVNLDRMTRSTQKLRGKFPSLVDNWSSVTGAERGYYIHVTKKSITLYDKRTNEPFQRYKSFRFLSDIQSCGSISAVKHCQKKPLLYVAIDHHLLLMDMRCGKTKDANLKALQRWSHGMMSKPTYMDIVDYDHTRNKEMVCLSSQWVEDMCVVSNYSDILTREGNIKSLTMPYRPPTILQTFHAAQRKTLCCSLYQPIRHRLCTSISGMSVIDRGEIYSILLQNSLGDVSCHTLYPEHMHAFIEDDSMEKLHEWSEDYKEIREPYEITCVVEISRFLQDLYQVPDDFILGRNTVITPRVKFNENEIAETYAKEQLDPEFLEIWKDPDEEITLEKTAPSQFFVDTS